MMIGIYIASQHDELQASMLLIEAHSDEIGIIKCSKAA
jgi:hypothetical protein